MFILAGAWALVVVALTLWPQDMAGPASPLGSLAAWHAHEMIFGFAAAGFAGYALTAISSWANGLSRIAVLMLIVLWVVARLAVWGWFGTDPRLFLPLGAAFMACVALVLLRAAWQTGSLRGGVQAGIATLLTGLQLAIFYGAVMPKVPVFAFGLLLSVVGGRMVAAFTWNQINQTAKAARRFQMARNLGLISAAAIVSVLVLDLTGSGQARAIVGLLLFGATLETARLLLWQSLPTRSNGLLGMLHLGYAWLPFGLALVAFARMPEPPFWEGDALHALAAGAVACSIYAVAARALARRANGLHPAFADLAGFTCLWLAAGFRVFAPMGSVWWPAAPALWFAGWGIFVARHLAALAKPSPRPVFSGAKTAVGQLPRD